MSLVLGMILFSPVIPNSRKIVYSYFSATTGTLLGEIEIYRAGIWGTSLLGILTKLPIILGVYGTPAILLISFAPMNRRQLAVSCIVIAGAFFTVATLFAHSESSTAALIYLALWIYGMPLAGIGHFGLAGWNRNRISQDQV